MNGNPITEIRDEAIPLSVVQDLHNLCVRNNWTMEDAVTYHRNALVPNGYAPNSFRPNIPESYLDKLRSLVATYRYRHRIQQFKEEGYNFSCYLYVPEVDPTTGAVFHEREDHCHILKRIWKHTREGGPDFLDVTSFDAAMMDPSTGLTHAALVGSGNNLSLMQRRCSPTWLQNSSESMGMKWRHIMWKQWRGGMKLLMGED